MEFRDLPWDRPLVEWAQYCTQLEEVPRGVSRHPVVFVNEGGSLFAIKELPAGQAEREFSALIEIARRNVPVVAAVDWMTAKTERGESSLLITRYLEGALPYRLLFMQAGLSRYRQHLLDAMAGLLVEIHLAGVFWGDCSLSNTLFRRDAGRLRAYLVDAETAELYPPDEFSPVLRHQDLEIMEEQVDGELRDLLADGLLTPIASESTPVIPPWDTGAYIRRRYRELWEEITREVTLHPDETYRIQERIRALNALGFSVSGVHLSTTTAEGRQLRLRAMVVDRNYYQSQLHGLTGLEADEAQARQIMNEIQEYKAWLSQRRGRSVPLSVAAYEWLQKVYLPVVAQLAPLAGKRATLAELYCQVLEHKWFLSERQQRDVGHQAAVEDYLRQFGAAEQS